MIGKVLGDRYEIIEKIGGGGMALVYKAKCRLLNRFVAVKVLRAEFTEDEEFVKKFKREAQAAASLSNPSIVGIYDVGKEDSIHYIVMEYVKGQTLKELIKSKGVIGIEHATNIAVQISSAIEHAHKNHIVHRDIKSHNILVREDNSIKVTDFGIARAVSSCTITNTGNIIGSVHYFSPEQARGGYTDEKSDIYSLGVVMYEMVTGMLPFEGESPIAIALKHIQETPVKPSQINNRITRSIEDIILKCMEKDVLKRYDNAGQIISDLKQSLVMPNGTFVKKVSTYTDENTKIIEPIKFSPAIMGGQADTDTTSEENTIKENAEDTDTLTRAGSKKSKAFLIASIFGGLLLALLAIGGIMYVKSLVKVDVVTVPDITNLSEVEAKDKLKQLGLFMEVVERIHNSEFSDGTVIRQDPMPNEKNKVTNPIKVIISKGPRKVDVPNLIGQSYDKVKLILENKGLVEGEFSQEYSDLPFGVVTSQSIEPGISVDEKTVVNYIISMGPEKFLMPNYTGMKLDQVKQDLLIREIILQNIVYEFSDQYPVDNVISQSIRPGTEVGRNSVIDITVSKGKEPEKPKPLSLRVPLPEGLNNAKITVFMVKGNDSEKIYEEYKSSSDSPVFVPISGQGAVVFEIYINGTLHDTERYDFEQ